jgi:hypothetical protein
MSPKDTISDDMHTLIDLDELMNGMEFGSTHGDGSLTESSISEIDTQSDESVTTFATSVAAENDSSQSDIDIEIEPQTRKRVGFGSIEIREYERIVGDHPDVKVGPPIGIGWQYYQKDAESIDTYENNRPPKRYVLRMTSITRKNMLRNVFNISEQEIRNAEKEVQKIQKLRTKSVHQSAVAAKVEDTFRRPFRRFTSSFTSDMMFKSFAMATPMGGMQF